MEWVQGQLSNLSSSKIGGLVIFIVPHSHVGIAEVLQDRRSGPKWGNWPRPTLCLRPPSVDLEKPPSVDLERPPSEWILKNYQNHTFNVLRMWAQQWANIWTLYLFIYICGMCSEKGRLHSLTIIFFAWTLITWLLICAVWILCRRMVKVKISDV